MQTWKVVAIIVALVVVLAASFVAGMVTSIRMARSAETEVTPMGVPSNACNTCEDNFWEWLCWLSGCP